MSAISSNYRTAESVSPGHPDKICDQISDAILDAYLAHDQKARVAVEACGGHGTVFLTGEVSSTVYVDPVPIVQRLAGEVEVINRITKQSPEIARGVDTGGAGDQGIMVGYACNETPELLPLEVVLARDLNQYLYKKWPYDGKTQITLKGKEVVTIVASFQNAPTAELEAAVKRWARRLKNTESGAYFVKYRNANPVLHINPAGDWCQGGFDADAGLTGRKLVVDNYGPRIPIGGGCFSGKDATKVDRSAAYAARRIADDLDDFVDVEQAAFAPSNLVPGISVSPDKMLQNRLINYADAQRYRVGVNHQQIPVNKPRCPVMSNHRDGQGRPHAPFGP